MWSIRSVTTNPPTTFKVARTTARKPSVSWAGPWAWPNTSMVPTRMMPWMALLPDMSGVWRMLGTLETTS